MANLRTFKGIRYNPARIPNLQDVITPPYDVIDQEQQELYRRRSPYNFVHIDLPHNGPDPYKTAANLFSEWLRRGVFIRDSKPCFYFYELHFKKPSEPVEYIRKGFITLVKLEEFGKGCVYPHEKTFSRVKQDRLNLMKSCGAQLSPVFALYSDPDDQITELLISSKEPKPVISFNDDMGFKHVIWKVTSFETQQMMNELFKTKEIFIADGHHRYETALAYRNEMRKTLAERQDAPFDYCLMYLTSMEHPGLTILPTHRVFTTFPSNKLDEFLRKAKEFFEITRLPLNEEGISKFCSNLVSYNKRGHNILGHTVEGSPWIYQMVALKDKVENFLKTRNLREEFYDIDVVILDNLVFKELYGLSDDVLNDEEIINFSHDTMKAFRDVIEGRYKAGFYINPTRIEQVKRIASSCLVMPHKATYFYPKVVSGMVIYKMDEHERN